MSQLPLPKATGEIRLWWNEIAPLAFFLLHLELLLLPLESGMQNLDYRQWHNSAIQLCKKLIISFIVRA